MGKSKTKSRTSHRTNPKAGKPSKPPTDPELAAIRTDKILPIIADLTSPDSKKRSSAISAIANLILDHKCRRLLLREQLVRIIRSRILSDTDLEIQARGWGILQKLLEEENMSFGIHLYRQDILTPLNYALSKVQETLVSENPVFSKLPKNQQNLMLEYTLSLIAILSHMSEASGENLEAISRLSNVPPFLLSIIESESLAKAATEAMSCLYALTEGSSYLSRQLLSILAWLEQLSMLKSKSTPVGMASCGVSFNLAMECQWSNLPRPSQLGADTDYFRIMITSLKEYLSKTSEEDDSESSIHLALEILSLIAFIGNEEIELGQKLNSERFEEEFEGFGNDEDENMDIAEEGPNGSKNEKMSEEGSLLADDMDIEISNGKDGTSTTHFSALYDADFLFDESFPLLIGLAIPSSKNGLEIRQGAITVLTKILFTLSSAESFLPESTTAQLRSNWAPSMWTRLISPALAKKDTLLPLATKIIDLAFSILGSSSCKYVQLQEGEVEVFMGLYNSVTETPEAFETTPEDELGANILEVLSRLALDPCPIPTNQAIGSFLINALIKVPKTPIPDVVAALDGLFLVYADKKYQYDEPVFRRQGFLSLLEQITPNLVMLSKSVDGRKEPRIKEFIQDGVQELGRFIKYKRDELEGKA